MRCGPHVKCPECQGNEVDAVHFPRYILLACSLCGFRWTQK